VPDYESRIPPGQPAAIIVHHPVAGPDEFDNLAQQWLGGQWGTYAGRRVLALPAGFVTVAYSPDGVHMLIPEGRPPMPTSSPGMAGGDYRGRRAPT
jgi:hypothetical protein